MTCVLRVPVEHVQDWPDTPQQLIAAIRNQLGEFPLMQFSDWKDYAEFWVSEKNAVLAKAARDGVCLTVYIARGNKGHVYLLEGYDYAVAFSQNPKPDARVLLL